MVVLCRRIEDACALLGKWVGWLLLALVVVVCASVLAAHLRLNVLIDWPGNLPLLGEELSINSLQDLQWHIFALVVVFGGVYAFRTDTHVNVDFLYLSLPPRGQLVIQALGHVLFLLPFAAITTWFAWKFMLTSYHSGEGSTYGGLQDRWMIKAMLPVAFALLGVAGLARTLRIVAVLLGARDPEGQQPGTRAAVGGGE